MRIEFSLTPLALAVRIKSCRKISKTAFLAILAITPVATKAKAIDGIIK